MPTELKKVVVDTYSLHAQDMRPNLGEQLFGRRAACYESLIQLGALSVRRRQRARSTLPLAFSGKASSTMKRRGHHVLGQPVLQKGTQLTGSRRGLFLSCHIRQQPLISGLVFMNQDDSLEHRGM